MLRWIGFLVVAVVLANVLGRVPLIGGFFRGTGIFGIWLTALGVAWLVSWAGNRAVSARQSARKIQTLGAVDTPHMRGKLGALHLAAGRARKARPLLAEAVAGEPDVLEWRYRLALAEFANNDESSARASLESVLERDAEYAYGGAQMTLAKLAQSSGDATRSLTALETFERNHGPTPESACRRGRALSKLNRKSEARAAFDEVGPLSRVSSHSRGSFRWSCASWLGRLLA